MWAVIGLLAATAAVCAFEVPGMVRKRLFKDLTVYAILLTASLLLSLAGVLNIPVPNPVKGIIYLFKPISRWLEQLL